MPLAASSTVIRLEPTIRMDQDLCVSFNPLVKLVVSFLSLVDRDLVAAQSTVSTSTQKTILSLT